MPKIGDNVLFLPSVDSTNSYAINQMSESEKSDGMVLCSFNQLKGRGQRNNAWQSQPDRNIAMTIILKKNLPIPGEQVVLNPVFALAIQAYIKSKKLENVSIKWPNDILVTGRKLAGILIENILQGPRIKESIVGIGININQKKFENLPQASSLAMETKSGYNLPEELQHVLSYCNKYWDLYLEKGREFILEEYNNYLFNKNKKTRILIKKDNQVVDVYPLQLLRDGILEMEDVYGHRYYFRNGEVEWLAE